MFFRETLVIPLICLGLCSCVSSIEDPAVNYHQTGRAQLKNGPIRLPPYTNEDHYAKLKVGVNFEDVIASRNGQNCEDLALTLKGNRLSTRLQTHMAKLKRFQVVPLHNRSATKLINELSEVGEVSREQADAVSVDLALSGTLTATKTRFSGYSKDTLDFTVECDFSCESLSDKTRKGEGADAIGQKGTVMFAEKAVGKVTRKAFYTSNGVYAGGHRPEEDINAVEAAAMIALADLANKLGNHYPVGGKITGVLGDRMTLDIGSEHGIAANQQIVVYAKVGTIKIPLAYAEASPDPMSSNLVIWRWNTDDRDAKKIIKQIDADPGWLSKPGNQLWAVGYGMAIPQDWEDPYKK